MTTILGFAGSRDLPNTTFSLIDSIISEVSGNIISVGCCVGADSLVLSSAIQRKERIKLFAIGDDLGRGFWKGSNQNIMSLSKKCFLVKWLAGGSLNVPIRARLARRSDALLEYVKSEKGTMIFFASSGPSEHSGTWRLVRKAVLSNTKAILFPIGIELPDMIDLFKIRWSEGKGVFEKSFMPSL